MTYQACATTRKSTQERNPINAPSVRKGLFRGQTLIDIKGFTQVRNLINVPTAASASAGAPASISIRDHTWGRSPAHSHTPSQPASLLQPCSALPGGTAIRKDLSSLKVGGRGAGHCFVMEGCYSEWISWLSFSFCTRKRNQSFFLSWSLTLDPLGKTCHVDNGFSSFL